MQLRQPVHLLGWASNLFMHSPSLQLFHEFDAEYNRIFGIRTTGDGHIFLRLPGKVPPVFQGEQDRMNLMIGPRTKIRNGFRWVLIRVKNYIPDLKTKVAGASPLNFLDRDFKHFLFCCFLSLQGLRVQIIGALPGSQSLRPGLPLRRSYDHPIPPNSRPGSPSKPNSRRESENPFFRSDEEPG
jgi:hypothetical protein